MNSVNHLAIIMDGNGRWAEQRGMPRWKGHEKGVNAVRRIAEAACQREIPILTLFAFSSENWKRPAKEIRILFSLLQKYLKTEQANLLRNGIRVSAFGRRDRLPESALKAVAQIEEATRNCRRLHLRIALDYGSRHEIVETARSLAKAAAEGRVKWSQITEEDFAGRISLSIPDPDLIIRTAGERRLSNFLLWQAAYSEFYFSEKCWPDFDESDLDDALADFHSRTRRFGAISCATGTSG
jgi:undecaprenyl diphosphate synthase